MENSEFKKNVARYIKTHKELHGKKGFRPEDVARDLASSFDYDSYECLLEVERQERQEIKDSKRYGLFVGRCMPFTIGHNAIIQDIIRDGRIPIMMLGGKNKSDDRHPLSYDDRVKLIRKVYPMGVKFIGLEDKDNWTEWYNSVKQSLIDLGIKKEQVILYAHNKEIDRKNFEYEGKKYENSSYTEMFKYNNIRIKEMPAMKCKDGFIIHATKIREDEEYAKINLDARIFRCLKDEYNFWT